MKKFGKITSVILCAVMLFNVFGVTCFARDMQTPFDNSRFYEQGEYSIHYRVFPNSGEKKGNILFLHGFGLSTSSFDDMIPLFTQEGYFCVSADLPNMGYSTRETAKTEIIAREELLFNLMTSLSDEKWILAGHSLGGGVSVNIASLHPEKVEKLLLFAPQTVEAQGGYNSRLSDSPLTRFLFNLVIKLGSSSRLLMKIVMYAAMQDNAYASKYDVELIRKPLQIKNTGAGLAVMAVNAMPVDYEKVSAFNIPALIIRGDKDNIAMPDNIDRLENALVNVQTAVVEDAGHMLIYTKAAEVFRISNNFLSK